MNTIDLAGFVATLSDDLAPAAVDTGTGLGHLLAEAETVTDDKELLTVMAAGFRLSVIADYLMAAAAHRAEAIGVPIRHKLKTGRDLLRELPLAPAVVARLGRLGDNLDLLPGLVREVRDGDLSLPHADAVITGISHVASRIDSDAFETVKDAVAADLLTRARWDSPAHVTEKARELGHRYAADDPPAPDGGRDPRTRGQRLADALVEVIEAYLTRPDRPTTGGIVPHISLTVPVPVLVGDGDEVPRLGFTGHTSRELARRVCCGDNEVAAIVMADGVPINITPNRRLATGALRQALIARDHGCQFPGCGKPAAWTEAHHIKEWAAGGETVLGNLVLLCSRHHHTAIHGQGWRVRIGADGHPWFHAPEGGDWMRCHHRRDLTLAATAAT